MRMFQEMLGKVSFTSSNGSLDISFAAADNF